MDKMRIAILKYFAKFVAIILKHASVDAYFSSVNLGNSSGMRMGGHLACICLSDMAWAVAYSIPRLPRAY